MKRPGLDLIKRCGLIAAASLALIAATSTASAQTARGTLFGTVSGTMPGTSRVAAGLQVSVKLTQNLSSKTSTEGEQWDGVLASDLIVSGHLLSTSGTQVTGVVSKVMSAAQAHGNGTIEIRLTSIRGTGVNSTPVARQGVNPALSGSGTVANAGIPGEANPNPAAGAAPGNAANGQALSEARFSSGAVLTFTTE